jgi:hypothetical protein
MLRNFAVVYLGDDEDLPKGSSSGRRGRADLKDTERSEWG